MKVNVRQIARDRGIKILKGHNPADVCGTAFRRKGQWYITVNPTLSPERRNFTIAHELSEIALDGREDLSLEEKHHQADRLAAEMLLPATPFRDHVHTRNLYELKEAYPQCSFEVVARRLLAFLPRVLTIFDNRRLTTRIASEGLHFPAQPTRDEQAVIRQCYEERVLVGRRSENLAMVAYFIDRGTGVERVILFTEVEDDFS